MKATITTMDQALVMKNKSFDQGQQYGIHHWDLTPSSTSPDSNEFIFSLLQRARRLVSMIHRSSVLDAYVHNEILLKQQEIDPNSSSRNVKSSAYNDPVIDFMNLWSSTYKILTRFIKVCSIMHDITHMPHRIDGLKTKQRLKLSKLVF